jgi:natural product precursor
MKTIKSLKLNQISKAELKNREMNFLMGGDCKQCACGCSVASTHTNGGANATYGYTYTEGWEGGGNDTCACYGNSSNCVDGAGKGHAL